MVGRGTPKKPSILAQAACVVALGVAASVGASVAAPSAVADRTATSKVQSVLLAPEVDVAAIDWSRQANGRAGSILLELLSDERSAVGLRVRAAEALGAVPGRATAAGLLAVLGTSPAPAIARAALLSLGRVIPAIDAGAPERSRFQIAYRLALAHPDAAARGAAATAATAVAMSTASPASIDSARADLSAALARETHAGARKELTRALAGLSATPATSPRPTDPLGARTAPPRRGQGSATPSR
jgi:hypothetical protein